MAVPVAVAVAAAVAAAVAVAVADAVHCTLCTAHNGHGNDEKLMGILIQRCQMVMEMMGN